MRVTLVNENHNYHYKSISHYSFKDLVEFLSKLVDIFAALEMKKHQKLSNREKYFFIASILLSLFNIENPISDDALQIYKKVFNSKTNKAEISNYMRKVSAKGWLRYDKVKKEVTIPDFFNLVRKDKFIIDFQFRMYLENEQEHAA